jgi:hypothetical protein
LKNAQVWIGLLVLPLSISIAFSTDVAYSQSAQNSLSVQDIPNLNDQKNTNLSINLTAYTGGNLAKVPMNFSVVEGPAHGKTSQPNAAKDKPQSATIIYTPLHNYTGPDSFTFKATAFGTGKSSNIGKVSLTVNPPNSILLYVATPEYRAGLAFGISLLIVLLIFVTAYIVIRRIRMLQTQNIKPRFWDIIRDDNWYPSLAIFQFLLWTGVVLFAYFAISLTRLFSGIGAFIDIPYTLILVMGISASVPLVGAAVSDFKYAGTTPTGISSTKEVPSDQIRNKLPGFKTMLMENDKITLSRFQMFAWTWIGLISYLGVLFLEVNTKLGNFENLFLPSLPVLFVSLMGLSQVYYLTAKSVKPDFVSVNEVRPGRIQRLQLQEANKDVNKEGKELTILGSNFGDNGMGTVWVEYYPPVTNEEKSKYFQPLTEKKKRRMNKEDIDAYETEWTKEFRYNKDRLEEQFKLTTNTSDWKDDRILACLDNIKDKLKHQNYIIRVEKDGRLTYANSDAAFEIVPTILQLTASTKSENVNVSSPIIAKFEESTRNLAIILYDPNNCKVDGKSSIDLDSITVTFTPDHSLAYNTRYRATLVPANDKTENPTPSIEWSFTTIVQPSSTKTEQQPSSPATPLRGVT